MNDKYGLTCPRPTRFGVEQQFEKASGNNSLRVAALVNDEANVGEVFADHMEKVVVERLSGCSRSPMS